MFSFSKIKILSVLFLLILIIGCAPPREKPNKDATNTGGSDELDQAIDFLKNITDANGNGLDLDLNELSSIGSGDGGGVSQLLPDPEVIAGNKEEINNAINAMEDALAEMDDPNSFQAAYVHLYLGYAYILGATAELTTTDTTSSFYGIITKDTTYHFDSTKLVYDTTSNTLENSEGEALGSGEIQSLIDAAYLLTGDAFQYPDPNNPGQFITPTSTLVEEHDSNAVEQLGQSVDIIGEILPDSNPEEIQKLQDDINGGAAEDITAALADWGFTPAPSLKAYLKREEE